MNENVSGEPSYRTCPRRTAFDCPSSLPTGRVRPTHPNGMMPPTAATTGVLGPSRSLVLTLCRRPEAQHDRAVGSGCATHDDHGEVVGRQPAVVIDSGSG